VNDTTAHLSISLDGYVAGADQTRDDPLGVRGIEVHAWHVGDSRATEADARAAEWLMRPRGAIVMGRNMFGPVRGPWDEEWRGWWGDEPPYHAPVFVLTHHPHDPVEMAGGTTFHFVTDGFDAAYARALDAAGGGSVHVAGGAATVRQALVADVVDELVLDIAPVLLGAGERLFDGVESFGLEPVEVLHSPLATHVRYRRPGGSTQATGPTSPPAPTATPATPTTPATPATPATPTVTP
jgi:dihydrofolate reductase